MSVLSVSTINTLHTDCISRWKAHAIMPNQESFYQLVLQNHAFNYQLWHAEDRARREDMGFEYVYDAKREIDSCNQQRNNCMEAMDTWLFKALVPANPAMCPVHSETPGMMIDRLSILALKSWHMARQTERQDVTDTHRNQCTEKLQVIQEQQKQLSLCLDILQEEIQAKTRTFRVYHQFKMYNDPALNPELYK